MSQVPTWGFFGLGTEGSLCPLVLCRLCRSGWGSSVLQGTRLLWIVEDRGWWTY